MKSALKKVIFPIEVLRYTGENMWCLPVTKNRYILTSIPFLHDIPPGSIIEAEENVYGELTFSKLIEKSDCTIYHCVNLRNDK